MNKQNSQTPVSNKGDEKINTDKLIAVVLDESSTYRAVPKTPHLICLTTPAPNDILPYCDE